MAEALKPGDPRRAGSYELLGRLGSGGMGQVFLGRSPGGRPVAVKVIRPELAGQADFRARFTREVAAARRVSALFTAPVVDADTDGEMPWLVTAYVPGPSLADAVSDHGPMRADVLHALAAGLAEGLAGIHAVGVVHRDLKPSNVLLASDGPRIIDFGISRAVEASALTRTGALVGSPSFMSPEQADGREAGPPSDVFSLGSVLTFAATGEGPFRAGTIPALLYQVVNAEPAIADVPASLRPLVERCLAKEPMERPTPGQIIAELGPTGLLQDWLPRAVAETLPKYNLPTLGRDLPAVAATVPPPRNAAAAPVPAGTGQAPAGQAPTGQAPAGQAPAGQAPAGQAPAGQAPTGPGEAAPSAPPDFRPLPQPQVLSQPPYRPPPPYRPAPRSPMRPQSYPPVPSRGGPVQPYRPPHAFTDAGRQPTGVLPREYRFGWLSLPILLFLAVAAFVLPLETYYCLTWGFALTLVVSRVAAAVIWVRRHGAAGIAGLAIRHLIKDIAGALGLIALAFSALFLTVYVLLPYVGPGSPQDYRQALNVLGPADPFSSLRQAWYFLHLFLLLSVLAVALVVLLRAKGNLGRPLVVPRAAKLLNRQTRRVRLIAASAVVALTVGLIGLNGGLSPAMRPSGAICVVAPKTCAAAAELAAASHHKVPRTRP